MQKLVLISVAAGALLSFQAVASDLKTDKERLSYFLGSQIGKQFEQDGIEIDKDAFFEAVEDVRKGGALKLTEKEMSEIIQAFQKKKMEQASKQGEDNRKLGLEFLTKNKAKSGVKVTDSGLQYQVIKAGKGPKPSKEDTVEVHYHGTLIDGTVFDSSINRGKTTSFPVGGVIPGWTEALQLMPEGSKWKLFIPSELAYGPRGTGGPIGPNATLIFDVELIKIVPKK